MHGVVGVWVIGIGAGNGQSGTWEDGQNVSLHGLLVKAVEPKAGGRWRARGASSGQAADRGKGVDEDAVCRQRLAVEGGQRVQGRHPY